MFNITLLITAYILFVLKSSFAAEIKSKCEDVIRNIENITDIPSGLLLGIGKAESGRILKNNEIVIWPWTINHAGKSLFFDNKSQMKLYLLKHTKKGDNNLDVGCMQINLKWHKQNFKDIKDMLAIEPNISYAASFLVQLKNKHGSWEKAIKHYHSSDPIKNKPYLNKVLSFWQSYKKNSIQIADNKTKINLNSSNTNNISESIKDTQPYLFARIDKVNFFRKIFQEK
ncbi:hypothetical protein OAO48_03580 [Alphaproteobacteria bacterium]|nr:hypothetical protein [Alphaproteobacteria bacterium]